MVSPMGQPVRWLRMMAVPETPPGAIWAGAKKRFMLTAISSEPTVRKARFCSKVRGFKRENRVRSMVGI